MHDLPAQDQELERTRQEVMEALAAVEREHPAWHCWLGVIPPLLYASRRKTSPPAVVRAVTPELLRQEIEKTERERGWRR